MTANITILIERQLVSDLALKKEGENIKLRLSHLLLTQEGFDYAVMRCFTIK